MSTCQIEKQILEQAHIGIWTIELEDGKAPRMYADDTMKRVLLGIHEELTPEEMYVWWYERIHPDYYDSVSEGWKRSCPESMRRFNIRGRIPNVA
ncbi:MAG: hypothetical protein Q4B72_00980 [Lachnospiraceae bacterium]|nr:hypothetical protein [Lachnospiraceae bacterium]